MRAELIQQDLEQEELFKRRARTEILAFTSYTKPDYRIGWHHRRLAGKLDAWLRGEIKNLMVFMPPRHGKSELVSRRLPALIHGIYPNDEIMAASYNDSLAGDMCIDVQKIIDSPEYQELFPGTKIHRPGLSYSLGKRNSEEHTIIGFPKGKYRGQGVGGSFTGKGANWVLVDDPIKGREIADSIAFRDRLWNFWLNDLYSRLETNLETGRQGQVLITLTRWHEDDLAGRLLDIMARLPGAMQFDIVKYPALRVDMDDQTDPREMGEALWPEKYNLTQLEEIRTSQTAEGGMRCWSSLYQQDPVPDGGNIFNEDMFEFCDLPGAYEYVFTTADTSYKEKQENDFTVFSVWGVIKEKLYLIDIWRKQVKSSDVEEAVEAYLQPHIKHGYRRTWIEPKGHGIYLNQQWAKKGRMMIPSERDIKEFYSDRTQDKSARANNSVPHLARRKVYIGNNIPNKEALVTEALLFPKGKHDDWVDTLVDALKMVYSRQASILDFV